MKLFLMISTLIFGLSILYGCARPVEEKQPVGAKEIVPISGTEKVKHKEVDEVAELENKGLSPDEIDKIKEKIAENMPLIESQMQEVLNMTVKTNTGDEVANSEKELKEAFKSIEIKPEDIQRKSTVEEGKDVSETP